MPHQQPHHHMAPPPPDYSLGPHGMVSEPDYRSQPGMYPGAVQSTAGGPYAPSQQQMYGDMENMYGYAPMPPQQVSSSQPLRSSATFLEFLFLGWIHPVAHTRITMSCVRQALNDLFWCQNFPSSSRGFLVLVFFSAPPTTTVVGDTISHHILTQAHHPRSESDLNAAQT